MSDLKKYWLALVIGAIAFTALGAAGSRYFLATPDVVGNSTHESTQDSRVMIQQGKDSTVYVYRTRLVKVEVPVAYTDSARGYVVTAGPCPVFSLPETIVGDTSGGYASLSIDSINCNSQIVHGIHLKHSKVTVQVEDSSTFALRTKTSLDSKSHKEKKDSTVTIREHEAWSLAVLFSYPIVSHWSLQNDPLKASVAASAQYDVGDVMRIGLRPVFILAEPLSPSINLDVGFKIFGGWR